MSPSLSRTAARAAVVSVVLSLALAGAWWWIQPEPELEEQVLEEHRVELQAQSAPPATPAEAAVPSPSEVPPSPPATKAEEGKVGKKDIAASGGTLGALSDGSQQGIGGLIGSNGTITGSGGLGARGRGLGGGGYAEGLGGLGTKGKGSGASAYGSGGGHFGAKGESVTNGPTTVYGGPPRSKGRWGYAGEGVPVVQGAPMTGDEYEALSENRFLTVADSPLSTFSIDTDTASYTNVRRYVTEGTAPPRDAVRIEELVNYFPYTYAPPTDGRPFAAHTEVTTCPWAPEHQLVRIGLKAREAHQGDRPPAHLTFLLDVSGSMASADRLPLVQRGMSFLASQLGPRDTVSIVVYAGAAGVVLPPTPGDHFGDIRAAITSLHAGGSTAGGAGIRLAYAQAKETFRKGEINRVILATDGDFNVGVSSDAELVQLIEEERKSGVFLTVLGVGRGNLQDAKMEQLADKGNGQYAYVDGFEEMQRVLGSQAGGTLETVAKDVKLQVEFNPTWVKAWRLVGYENRVLADRDFNDDTKDAGEIGAGHTVTALYELVPSGVELPAEVDPLRYQSTRGGTAAADSDELLTFKVRYKDPEADASQLLAFPVAADVVPWASASTDTRWAAVVASWGMNLRASPHRGSWGLAQVAQQAESALGSDPGGYRRAFLDLVRRSAKLVPA